MCDVVYYCRIFRVQVFTTFLIFRWIIWCSVSLHSKVTLLFRIRKIFGEILDTCNTFFSIFFIEFWCKGIRVVMFELEGLVSSRCSSLIFFLVSLSISKVFEVVTLSQQFADISSNGGIGTLLLDFFIPTMLSQSVGVL